MSKLKTYTWLIKSLPANGIFVFGSNKQGRHFKGAAQYARLKFGAIVGQPYGRQGESYAIVTKDIAKSQHPSIGVKHIVEQIKELYNYAREHTQKDFYITYSGAGTLLSGYSTEQMSRFFAQEFIPDNVIFEDEFAILIEKYRE